MAKEQTIPVVDLRDFTGGDEEKRNRFVQELGDALAQHPQPVTGSRLFEDFRVCGEVVHLAVHCQGAPIGWGQLREHRAVPQHLRSGGGAVHRSMLCARFWLAPIAPIAGSNA